MKLKHKFSLALGLVTVISVPTILLASCKTEQDNNNSNENDKIEEYIPESMGSTLSNAQINNQEVYSIGTFNSRIIGEQERTLPTEYYDSEVYKKYHDTYNFRYPGQDFNYEQNNQNIFTNINDSTQTINGFDVVFNERVTNENGEYINSNGVVVADSSSGIKYNNPDWIVREIENGTFKKHRAADKMFLNDVSQIKSVTKHFEVSTAVRGNLTLGLFVPAGEVVEITFDDDSWELIQNRRGTISFVVNQNMWDNRASNDSGKISNRYPFIETSFGSSAIKDKTFRIGSPFGGGLSININQTITKSGEIPLYSQVQDVGFTVKGALPCLFYEDGKTKEKEWYEQLQKASRNEIAPVLQAWSPYFSLSINFNGLNKIGGRNVTDLIYPINTFKKWNDFLFLSNYYAGNDLSGGITRLNMEFCDDIWGGAAAWGGGMNFYCPTNWGVNLFFYSEPEEVFNASSSWGVFHEINHNFQQNAAFFRKNTHPETNQVTAFNLSIISDITRFRNEINYTGENVSNNYNNGWCYLDTPYSIMKKLHNQGLNLGNEYPIYSILLFFMGSKNYVDYVRKDVREHSSGSANWTGISEIGRISDTFKLNMWPAFKDYSQYWYDWSISYEEASQSDKEIIDRIQSYTAVDFVANQYACGSYLYNSETNEYTYTEDVLPAFEIPPQSPYTFDFENMITSTNRNFNFTSIEFPEKTKLGGKLSLDPSNNKKLIYTPNNDKVADIDEFDISIIPGEWTNKPDNYVNKYKFKIKVRQEINLPILETYPILTKSNANDLFNELDNLKPDYVAASKFNTVLFSDSQKRGSKFKYKFVAPKDGFYKFENTYDDYIRVFVNGELVYREDKFTNEFKKTYEKEMKKGEVIEFENQIINTGGSGGFDLKIKYRQSENDINEEELNKMSNIISPTLNDNLNYLELLSDSKYKYKIREINREIFNKSLTSIHNLSTYSLKDSIIESYTLTSPGRNVDNLKYYNDNNVEVWGPNNGNPVSLELNFSFDTPQYLSSIYVAGRTNNWTNARPSKIKVLGYSDDSDSDEIVLYDGDYGNQFGDRFSDISKLNFTNPKTVKKAKVTLINENMVSGNQSCISLKWVKLSNYKFIKMSNSYGFNNPLMNVSLGWSFRENDDFNSSALSNLYVNSIDEKNKIAFTLNNCSGFAIIGQLSNKNPTLFDVYVNGVLYEVNYHTSDKLIYNDSLFHYQIDEPQNLKVEIVTKSKDPLYLNYVMTFGDNVFLS